MEVDNSPSKQAGDQAIANQARSQVRTFFDEIKNGTRNYRTVASLNEQIAQEYRGRCVLELLQNAHDALAYAGPNDQRRISFMLNTHPEPVLLVANTGHPFRREDFKGICQLAQSPKDPNESVGNKGLGFRSVLEVSGCPEIWSTAPLDGGERFVFRFDPAVIDRVAEAAQALERHGLDARSPFDAHSPLVDWYPDQLIQYRQSVAQTETDAATEAREFLSPYSIPLPAKAMPPDVRRLLEMRYATVVRLRLDGGRMLAGDEAVQSVKKQLDDLQDAQSVIFLEHLAELVIEVDGDQHVLNRALEADVCLAGHPRTRQRRLRIETMHTAPADSNVRQFHVWTRVVGGDHDADGAEAIRAAVEHLPNRWPCVRQATIGVAVEDAPVSAEGVFVIFLPTEKTTGTGAHVNAPFYGTLDRRQINFNERYNELILRGVLDLCLDAVGDLIAGCAEAWRARAVLDILSSVADVGGEQWPLVSQLCERAVAQGRPLHAQATILCDDGWRIPGDARVMANISDDDRIGGDRWRQHAGFAVVSKELDCRRDAVRKLLEKLGGDPNPSHQEWVNTIERLARQVRIEKNIDWNDFLSSLLTTLPDNLRALRPSTITDPLVEAHFLPTADGRLIAASDPATLFFRPVQGVDDVAELVEDVPTALTRHIAFLHRDVRTHEGQPRRNTEIQKFLDDRFASVLRREDLLRKVVTRALPSLPAVHGTQEAADCAEILAWTLRLLGDEPLDTLSPLLQTLPVCCDGGWFRMSEAVFGPGWQERHGDDVAVLVDELPDRAAQRLRKTMLLPPNDERWGAVVEDWGHLFELAGVFDGLRLQEVAVTFGMNEYNNELLQKLPTDTPPEAWADWYNNAVDLRPHYVSWHQYELSRVQLLPEIHHLATLKQSGRRAFSRLVLASLGRWAEWESVTVRKSYGRQSWRQEVASPLKHWLRMTAWLSESDVVVSQPLSRRWLVPESLLRGQAERYAHLDPLSLDLARELNVDPALQAQLSSLGLNVYPTEDDQTGPELLEALARAWTASTVPRARFDVFLGQVRDAWRHFNPNEGLPDTFLVRTGQQRSFSTRGLDELTDVYLPDDAERTRTLREHGKDILELRTGEARRIADVFIENVDIKRASQLEERHSIDGTLWEGRTDGVLPLDQTKYEWLPIVLLSIAAYGGANPAGATTAAWRSAADRLQRTGVLECAEIDVALVDGDHEVGRSQPRAQRVHGDILAIRRDLGSYEDLAAAAQAVLDRQDLLKDLRLVLGKLPTQEAVTPALIEDALGRSEIDSQALADIRQRWSGELSLIVDRVRPVLKLFDIPEHGLDTAATHIDRLSEWLSVKFTQWDTQSLLSAARKSRDDHAMGIATWRVLGDDAQLSAWNAALAELGDRYETVENRNVTEETKAHLDEAKALLRGLARHVAVEAGDPALFVQVEEVSRDFVVDADWSKRWWEVPFGAVLGTLRDRYAQIPGFMPCFIEVIEGSKTVKDLRGELDNRGIAIAPDPYGTADRNRHRLEQMLDSTRDLHRTWTEACGLRERGPELPEPIDERYATAYLEDWPDDGLLAMALEIVNDREFTDACNGCSTLDAVRQQLDLTPEAVEARREERHRLQREVERQRRTFDVAGEPFEVGSTSYRDLFDHLDGLSVPEGPQASKGKLTALSQVGKQHSGSGGTGRGMPSHRPSTDLTDLVGIVGEIWAYRILRQDFGEEAVTREDWVSEIRLKVQPPVDGERHDASDNHGFDFRFTHQRTRWHVEVKATAGDDSQFELGISEIRAANRLAQKRGQRWLILRVLYALSGKPKFEWLPNPFENGSKELFRLHRGGMRVSYSRV